MQPDRRPPTIWRPGAVPGRQHRRRPPSAADFLEEFHVQHPQLADPSNALLDQLRIPGLPVTLILGSDGTLLGKHVGPFEGAELEQLLSGIVTP